MSEVSVHLVLEGTVTKKRKEIQPEEPVLLTKETAKEWLQAHGYEFKEYPNGLVHVVEKATNDLSRFESWDEVVTHMNKAIAEWSARHNRNGFKIHRGGKGLPPDVM